MTRPDYQRYLASREWALLKEGVRKRSGGNCERCTSGRYEETHHVTYERIGHERPEDLLGVCSLCHAFLSGKTDVDPCVVATTSTITDSPCVHLVLEIGVRKPMPIDLETYARLLRAAVGMPVSTTIKLSGSDLVPEEAKRELEMADRMVRRAARMVRRVAGL